MLEPTVHQSSSKRWVLVVLCVVQFMLVLDVAIVAVALPWIQDDLAFDVADLQWVVSAYALTFAGFLILGGRAGDLFGRRRFLLAGITVFTLASLACGLAQSSIWLVIARGVQGFGGALASPAALSLLTTTFAEGEERNRALGVWGAVAAGGASTGVLIGGVITDVLDWRWVFLVNVPIGVVLVVAASRAISESRDHSMSSRLDIAGSVTITASLIAFVYGLSRVEGDGLASATVVGWFTAGVISAAAFIAIELRSDHPLVPLRIFRSRQLTVANIVEMLNSAVIVGVSFFVSLYLQQSLGYSPIATGLGLLPNTVGVMVVATLVPKVIPRVGVKTVIVAGSTVMTLAMLALSRIDADGSYLSDVLGPLLLVGVGLGCTFTGALVAATAGVADDDQGLASGLLNTSEQVGFSLGIAILASAAASRTAELADRPPLEALTGGFQRAFEVGAGIALLATVIAVIFLPARVRLPVPPSPTTRSLHSGTDTTDVPE